MTRPMEAVGKTLTYRDHDTGPHRKLLPGQDQDTKEPPEIQNLESNYVDLDNLLDMKSEATKTVKVTFTGEGNQRAVIKCCDTSTQNKSPTKSCENEDKSLSEDFIEEHPKDKWIDVTISGDLPLEPLFGCKDPQNFAHLENENQLQTSGDCSEAELEEYTDMYLNCKTESDDGASAVASDHCESETVQDESHYITTHEIQLTELDHDADYDLGQGTWDFEDDNLVYSFVDYAFFESDETQEGTLVVPGDRKTQVKNDVTHNPCVSSDESVPKAESGDRKFGNPGGGIPSSSIKTFSREDSDNIPEDITQICDHNTHAGLRSRLFGTGAVPRDTVHQYFIPAPRRQHLATKLRWNDVNEYSSGGSSSISELDDADKEVRNLTAKSFRSLACPYFDAINLSTSSESSMSEYGLNKWSAAYVNLNHGGMPRRGGGGGEPCVFTHKSLSATLELSKAKDSEDKQSSGNTKAPQSEMHAMNKKTPSKQAPPPNKQVETQPQLGDVITLTETFNFHCNVEAGLPEGKRRLRCSRSAHGSHTKDGGASGDIHTHKRAIFASSHLKNVISKKMQFEQERKMERGELRDSHPALSPCFQCKEQEAIKERNQGRDLQRQTSESGSGYTVTSLEEKSNEGSGPHSCEATETKKRSDTKDNSELSERGLSEKNDSQEPPKAQLTHSQHSAFISLREGEPQKEREDLTALGDTTVKDESDASNVVNKLSQLFVSSSQLLPKETSCDQHLSNSTSAITSSGQQLNMDSEKTTAGREENGKGEKAPEIKIRLRSVKENKGYTLNIASLLTPKISNTFRTLKTAGEMPKCQVLSTSDKIPHFAVRDVRDTKCKFQTPIYHVRDVRKLVKSSYHFVTLDSNDNKCSTSAAADVHEDKSKTDSFRQVLPSPIVIKCNSVKTNSNVRQPAATPESSSQLKQGEVGRSSPKTLSEPSKGECTPSHWTAGKEAPAVSKPLNPEQSELKPNIEARLAKRLERLTSDTGERKGELKVPNQAALEKLQAAVKTMEQLYVFDRNEWKRKNLAPQPITGSHVLSLIASEEHGAEEPVTATVMTRLSDSEMTADSRIPQIPPSELCKDKENKGSLKIIRVPYYEHPFKTQSQQGETYRNKHVLHFGNNNKTPITISSVNNDVPQMSSTSKSTVSKAPVAPLSFKIETPKHTHLGQSKPKSGPNNATAATFGTSDPENYLTIPGLGHTSEMQLQNQEQVNSHIYGTKAKTGYTHGPEHADGGLKRSPFVIKTDSPEVPPATIYHHSPTAIQVPQPQVFCLSPSIPTLSPIPGGEAILPQTQRKMLLDVTTGHYYLVDTPVQPTTKRLFDPETGQYVDVPMSRSPVAPITPLPVSPLTLNPGAYVPTYMIYPGLIPSPTQNVQPECFSGAENANGKPEKYSQCSGQEASATGAESPYYSATGETTHVPLQLPVTVGNVTTRESGAASERKPVISITTQQGPRIIAPPSFDGTTMSFVVEHR